MRQRHWAPGRFARVADDDRAFATPNWRPWTLEGHPDLLVPDAVRDHSRRMLTDPSLEQIFRRRHPLWRRADYDEIVRALDFVWDCPGDGTVNVTGYCCAICGRRRVSAAG